VGGAPFAAMIQLTGLPPLSGRYWNKPLLRPNVPGRFEGRRVSSPRRVGRLAMSHHPATGSEFPGALPEELTVDERDAVIEAIKLWESKPLSKPD
jgi:hypothetical protein